MKKDEQTSKRFIEEQLEWCRKQDSILAEIERKLYEMKDIAEYAASKDFSSEEIAQLNDQLNRLKKTIRSLELQLYGTVH